MKKGNWSLLWFVGVMVLNLPALGRDSRSGFVTLADGRALYAEFTPAAPGKSTLVLLNGMTHDVRNWDAVVSQLDLNGVGLLRYDLWGQGETLLAHAPATDRIPLSRQIDDLAELSGRLGITGRIDLAGLSYGGGLALAFAAKYPGRVGHLIVMAPYVEAVADQDAWIKTQVAFTRLTFPMNPASDDELYDYFLRNLVYQSYPLAEPSVLSNPFKLEATFRLTQGIRTFRADQVVGRLPIGSVHLMIAGNDQYITHGELDRFWSAVPQDRRGSRIKIEGVEHKFIGVVPQFAAAWLSLIERGDTRIAGGRSFAGQPHEGTARSGQLVIPMPVE